LTQQLFIFYANVALLPIAYPTLTCACWTEWTALCAYESASVC